MEQSPFGFFEKSPRQKTTTENENPFVKFNESMNNQQRDAEKERVMKELAKKFQGENLQSQDENQNTQGYHDAHMMRSHAGNETQMRIQQTLKERAQLLRKKPTNINYNDYPETHPYRNPYIPAKTLDGTYVQFPRDPFIKRVRAGRLAPARNVPQTGSRFSLRASSDSQESENNTNSWQDEDNNPPHNETRPPPAADNVGELQAKRTAELEAKMATVQVARRVADNVKTIAEIDREEAAARRSASKGDKNNNPPFKSRTFGSTSPTHGFGGFTFVKEEALYVVKEERPSVVNKNETPILLSASLRACVFCSAVKLRDVFFLDGCSTCEQFVSMKGDMEKVKECTTTKFVGFVNIPMNNDKCTMFAGKSPGFYAIIEEPSAEMIEKMHAQGVEYRPLAFFK